LFPHSTLFRLEKKKKQTNKSTKNTSRV
jgi:hypothetical protein